MILPCNNLEFRSPQQVHTFNYQILGLFPPKTLEGNLWSFILVSKSLENYDETKPLFYQDLPSNYRVSLVLGDIYYSLIVLKP